MPGYWERIAREKAEKVEKTKKAQASARTEKNLQVEQAYWDSAKSSNNPAMLQTYLKKYPQGRFAELAMVSIQSIKDKDKQHQQAIKRARIEDQRRKAEATKRAQELAEQRKLLAELKKRQQNLAVAKPSRTASELKLEMGSNRIIAVAGYAPIRHGQGSEGFDTVAQYLKLLRGTLKEGLRRFTDTDVTITEIQRYRTARSLKWDHKGKRAKKVCKKLDTDYVFAVMLQLKTKGPV